MNRLTALIVRRPVAAAMIIVAILVFGFMSIISMDQEATPEMEFPMMIVFTTYVGAGPEDVDKLVTQRLEGAASSLNAIKTVTSMSQENVSIIILQYEYGTDMDTSYIDLKESLDLAKRNLPDDAGDPTVIQMSSMMSSSIYLSLNSEDAENLLRYVEDDIVPEFTKLSTVADVTVSGGQEDYIRVELREDMLKQYGVNMSSVVASVSTADFSQPSGDVDYGSQNWSMSSSVSYKSVSDLENLPISLPSGGIIRLSDVANVYETTKDSSSLSRYNGNETISLSITKRQSSSAVRLSEQVQQTIAELMVTDPGISIEMIYDESETIQSSISSVAQTLLLAIVISMAILFLFFGDFKASLIVGSSMPVSLLVAFICMNAMGFTINVITMGAMVLGVGMMVDNSIVVIDSCFKSVNQERTFAESAIEGAKFVMLSIVASTITTIVVFLPLATIEGLSGQMFRPLGFTVAFALIASLFSAITLVPFFFVRYQPEEKRKAPLALLLKRLERVYNSFLKRIVRKRVLVTVVTVILIAASLWVAGGLNMELMTSTDEGTISIAIDTRPGLQLEKANALVMEIEEMVADHEDVESYNVSVGGGSMLTGSSNSITAYLYDKRKMDTDEIVEEWRLATKDMVDCEITVSSSSSMTMTMSSDDVQINIKGNDLNQLAEFSRELVTVVESNPNIIKTTTSLEDGNPKIDVVVDPMKAAAHGLTPSLVANSLYSSINGLEAATITRDGQDYTVQVEYPADRYTTLNDVEDMILITTTGKQVPLMDVATLEFSNAPQALTKEDSQYIVTITGTPTKDSKFDAERDIYAKIGEMEFPQGINLAESSMTQMMNEEFYNIGMAIVTAILLVFMVMAIQFESIRHSIMVMICIPLSLIGSVALLSLANSTINMVSLLGFLVLVGTVVNNGILFVDTANQFRQTMPVDIAIVAAARTRLRPIMMTTLTTVLSMVPMAIGLGTGSEMMQSMGLVVIGGLTASTVLTLLLLPTFYLIFDGNRDKRLAKKEEKTRRKQEERARRQRFKNNNF